MGNKASCCTTPHSPITDRRITSQPKVNARSGSIASPFLQAVVQNTNPPRANPILQTTDQALLLSPSEQTENIRLKLNDCCFYSHEFYREYSVSFSYMLGNVIEKAKSASSKFTGGQILSKYMAEKLNEYLTHIEDIIDLTTLLGKGNWYRNSSFYTEKTITPAEKEMRDLSIKHYSTYKEVITPRMSSFVDLNGLFYESTTLNTLRALSPTVRQMCNELEPLKDMTPRG